MTSAKEFFLAIAKETEIQTQRAFWDEARHGKKPDSYFVWRLSTADEDIESDNESEHYSLSYAVSVYTKTDNLDTLCAQVESAVENLGAYATRQQYEDYEKDTGYFHGEMTVTRIF